MWNFFRFWNFAPNARSDSYSTNENGVLHVGAGASVLKNDTDLNRDQLSIVEVNGSAAVGSPVTLASGAKVTLNADGTFDYDPNGQFDDLGAGQTATDSFSYRVADGRGGFDTATVSIKINGVGAVDKKPLALLDLDKATAGAGDTHGNVITGQDPDTNGNKLLLLADNQGDGPAIIRSITHDGVTYTLNAAKTDVTVSGTPAGAWSYDDGTGDLTITTDLGGTLKIDLDGATPGEYTYTPPASIGSGWWQSLPPFLRDIFNFKTETFSYKIEDTDGDTSTSLLTVTVKEGSAPANQAPSGADATIVTNEDTPHTFTTGEFGFTDSDGNALQAVMITTLPADGELTLDGVAVAAGDVVSAADIAAGLLVFSPAENANGAGYASLSFQVQDDGGTANGGVDLDQTPNTITIDVTAVNDAPDALSVGHILFEDTVRVFGLTDFVVVDDADSPPNALQAVKITTLPDSGSLTLDGVAVAAGDFISADDIAAGKLMFTPEANSIASTSFTFQVQDDGGTANGGANLDPTPNQQFFQFMAVNDAPVAADDTATTDEDIPVNIDVLANDSDIDSPNLLVKDAVADHGTVVIEADNTITYTPDANFNGGDTITYTVADGDPMFSQTKTDTATVTVTVNAVNDPPVAPSFSLGTIATGGSRNITSNEILAHVTDVDSATVTLESLTIQSGAGTLQALPDGTWLYTGVAGDTSDVVFAYTVSDGLDASTGQAFLNLNHPVAASEVDLGSGPEDTPQTFTFGDFLAGVDDDDGPSLGVTSVSVDPAFGVVQQTGGTWTFTPAPNYFGPVTFTYTVSDGLSSATSTATFTVTPVNDAPVVYQGIADQSVDEDTAWSFAVPALAFGDLDGDALTLTATLADGGALPTWLSFDGATFTGTLPQDFNGDIALTVTASDASDSAETSFTLTVNPVNDAPSVDQGISDQSVDEGTPWSFAVPAAAFTDVDGDALTLTATLADGSALPVWLSFDGTSFTGTPPQDFNGDLELKVVASDGNDTGETTFTLTVNPINDAPVASLIDAGTTNEDAAATTIDLLATASDADMDVLSAQNIVAIDDLGVAVAFTDNLDGTIAIDPAQYNTLKVGESRTVTVSYEVFDGTEATTNTATLVVEGVNDAPIADDQSFSIAEESAAGTVVGTILATDIEGEDIRFIVDPADTGPFSVDVDTGVITLAQDVDDADVGDYIFTVDVLDRSGGTTPITVTATVGPINDAPVIADQSFSVPEESLSGAAVGTVLATDPDDTNLTYAITAGNDLGLFAIDASTGAITLAQDVDDPQVGSYALTVTVDDGTNPPQAATVTIDVTPINDAPATTAASATGAEDAASIEVALSGSDVDGTVTLFTISTLPVNGSLYADAALTTVLGAGDTVAGTGNAATVYFVPAADFNGPASFTYAATDDQGLSDATPATASITVTPENDAPVAADGSGSALEDRVGSGLLPAATDPDGDPVTYAAGSVAPQHGMVTIQPSGAYDYSPDDEFNGIDSFSYTVSDGNGGVNEYNFEITVTPVNDAPFAPNGTVTLDEDTAYVFAAADFGFADPFDNPANNFAAVIIGSAPLAGTLALDGVALTNGAVVSVADIDAGKLVFTPAPDGNGSGYDAFTFRVQDDGGTENGGSDTSNLRTIHIDVNPTPDDLIAADDFGVGFQTDEATAFTTDSVLANDSDPDGGSLMLTGFDTTGTVGLVTYNDDGTFSYDPNGQFEHLAEGENATDTFTYTISDGASREETATVTVTIDGVNDAPRAIDDSFGSNSDYDAFVVGSGEVYLGVNNGDGTFVDTPLVQDALTREGAAFGDLNGDGNLDVFVAGDGTERVWINDGQGNLTQVSNVTTLNDGNNYDVELGDLNGDGKLDAVVASDSGNANRIWLNDGSGTSFTAGASLNYGGKTTTYDVAIADIDKDGDLDIIEANAGVNRIWLNQGGGVFSTANVINFGSAAENSRDVAVADLNDDGYLDIFIANEDSGNTVWLNNGDSTDPTFTQVPGSLGNGESRAVALGDLNGDGTIDAFVANSGSAGSAPDNNGAANEVWFNDGEGNFTLSANNGVPLGNGTSLDVELADFDGDGDLDALVANNANGQPNLIWYNDGDGNFTSDGTAIGTFAARDVALGDIDGDAALPADQVQVFDVLANDADPDASDDLTIISIDAGDLDGALTIAADGKSIEFDPSGSATLQALVRDSLGTYSFTYTVSDGHGGTDTASVEITVRGVTEPPALTVNTLTDDSYEGGTLAEELADGGGLSLREAVGLINDGLVSETLITFDTSIAGGQITAAGGLTITADMDIDGGTAGMTVDANGSDRVFTIDGGTTSISASLNALTITGGGSVNRGGGVRVLDGDQVSISNSLLVGNDANNFGDAIAVESGASATLTNTTVADNGVGTSYAVQSDGDITMSNVTVTGNARGVSINGGTATTVNSIVLGNGGTADFTVSGFGTTYAFNGLSIIGEGSDSDPSDGKIDGDPVQVFASSDPSGAGILADNGGPTLTVALRNDPSNPALDAAIGGTDTDQRGVAAFDAVTGTGDSDNNRDIGAYELSANAPHAPIAADDAFTGPEDTEITGNVLADNGAGPDSDADNDVLSVIAGTFATAEGGSVVIAADGSFVYTPAANFNGADSFDYRVSDGTLTDIGTVTLTVTPAPDAPVAIDDAFTGRQDSQISGNVLDNNGAGADYDPDGDTPSVVEMSVANIGGGGINLNEDGSFIYAPAAGFTGTESFTYTVRDAGGLTDTGRITFTVVPNVAPVATGDGYSLDEDTTLTIAAPGLLVNDSDANGDALSAILVDDVANGTLTLNGDGSFSYMPDTNFNGADSFTYKTNDGLADSNTVTVNLTVNPVDDPEAIVGDLSGAVSEDGTLVANGSVSVSDVDGDLSSTDFVPGIFVDPDGYGQFRVFANGDWQFTLNNSSPLVQQLGVDPIFGIADTVTRSYTVESLEGALSETVDITISGTNDVATISGDSAGTVYAVGYAEGPINDAPIVSGKLDISDADAGQDILSTGLLAQSTLGTFDYDADGNWTFDLNENYSGLVGLEAGETLTVTYELTSLDGTASQDVTITVERLVSIHIDPNLATIADPGTTDPVDPIATPIDPIDPIATPTTPPATPIEGGIIGASAAATTVATTDTSSASTTTTTSAPGELFTYHLGDGPIAIADFTPASSGQAGDHIVLSGFDLDFGALDTSGDGQIDSSDASVTGDPDSLTLDFGNGDTLTVAHVSALHEDDLLFS